MAITQPGGAGTTIYLYDDAGSASGTGYTWAEIAAAFPADFISNGTFLPSYRSAVTVQIGDTTTNAATTSLIDTTDSTVIFDSGRTLAFRSTQTTSWFLTLGTKIGTGDEASGHGGGTVVLGAAFTGRGTIKLYGCKWVMASGACLITSIVDDACEFVNTMFQSRATGTAPFSLGTAVIQIDNIYNVDFSHSTTSGQVAAAISANTAQKVTVSGGSAPSLLANNSPSQEYKDLIFFGAPSQSCIRWTSSGPVNWQLVRPTFPAGYAKFGGTTGPSSGDTGAHERWIYDVKCVTGDGDGVSGIPVKLTDAQGNVQVNTTTDANGEISHGSGLTTQSVIVMDHYMVGSTYTQRGRSPFLVEINMPYQSGYNNNYLSHRYYFTWPGDESVTTTSGTFEDVADVIQMTAVSSGGSTWTETVVP